MFDIRLQGVKVTVGVPPRQLFSIRDYSIPKGSKCFIEGPSGCGKTTLLHLMAGLLNPDEGKVCIGKFEYRYLSESERGTFRKQHMGVVFQKLNVLDHLTVLENVQLLAPRGSRRVDAEFLIDRLGLTHCRDERVAKLSLGEQQRTAVARALFPRPKIVLADEPTSSLDDANAKLVLDALLELQPEATVVIVSHDARVRSRIAAVLPFSEFR